MGPSRDWNPSGKRYLKGERDLTTGGVSTAGFEDGGNHGVGNGEWPLRADGDPI